MPTSVSNDMLQVDGFITSDIDIVSYFTGLPDSEDEDKALETLLKLGILTQNSAGPVISAKYVETVFDNLKEKMTQNIDSIFGSDGDFARLLEKHFGEGGTVKEILDPDMENTPLNKLRATLQAEISEIKGLISEKKGYLKAAKKGTQKGKEFEERCIPYICSVAEPYSDTVESTGDSAGDLSTSKKGDFVVTIDGTEKRFILEMKHYTSPLALTKIRQQLDEAMENRRADYGVLVSRNRDVLPKEVGWFNEYDKNKLVCAVSDTDDDDENMWVLATAYRWARFRIMSDVRNSLGIDPDTITKSINEIKASIKRMQTVTTKCKSINKATEEIERVMKNEKRKIEVEIDGILYSLKHQDS